MRPVSQCDNRGGGDVFARSQLLGYGRMTVQIRVLYFAAARDAAGRSEEEVTLPEDVTTIADFLRWLGVTHPMLLPYLGSLRIAVNEQFGDALLGIQTGDVLAVIPPVAGG